MFHGSLILLPVCRNILAFARDLPVLRHIMPVDKNIHFHKIVAWTMVLFTCIHVGAHMANFHVVEKWQILGPDQTAIGILTGTWAGITGMIMLCCMALMVTSSLSFVRRASFELFWYTHHLSIPFIIALCFHSNGCFVKQSVVGVNGEETTRCKPYGSWRLAVVGLVLYTIERLIRVLRSRKTTFITKIVQHPHQTIELQFRKDDFSFRPGTCFGVD
jgi:NADPH oxidase